MLATYFFRAMMENIEQIVQAVIAAMEAKRPTERPRRSESIGELVKALSQARSKIKSVLDASQEAKIKPRDPNKPVYSYSYEDLPEILNAIYPGLSEHGLEVIGFIRSGRTSPVLIVELHHAESSQWVASEIQLRDCNDPKEFAGQVTSYRRVVLKTLLNLASKDPEKNDSSSNGTHMISASYGGVQPKQSSPNPSDQRSRINVAMKRMNLTRNDVEELIVANRLPQVAEMNVEQGDALLQLMESSAKMKAS